MTFFRSYAKKLFNSEAIIQARNHLGLRPQLWRHAFHLSRFTISDAFIWRNDQGLKTIVRISDIPRKYFGVDGNIFVCIFGPGGEHIAEFEVLPTGESFQFTIENSTQIHKWGYFTAMFRPSSSVPEDFSPINRCYVGYGRDERFMSFVHGNMYFVAEIFGSDGVVDRLNAVREHKKNTTYIIQRDFADFENVELFLANPLKRNISLSINGERHQLAPRHLCKIDVRPPGSGILKIESDFAFPRPTAFAYRNGFFDVHHC